MLQSQFVCAPGLKKKKKEEEKARQNPEKKQETKHAWRFGFGTEHAVPPALLRGLHCRAALQHCIAYLHLQYQEYEYQYVRVDASHQLASWGFSENLRTPITFLATNMPAIVTGVQIVFGQFCHVPIRLNGGHHPALVEAKHSVCVPHLSPLSQCHQRCELFRTLVFTVSCLGTPRWL